MKSVLKLRRWMKILRRSRLFNPKYYLFSYPEVRYADIDPIKHFIKFGSSEGKNPSAEFDTLFYQEYYNDVKDANIPPLVHYILYGEKEGRLKNNHDLNIKIIKDSGFFDEEFYYHSYPEIKDVNLEPIEHYVKFGIHEGKKPNAYFDIQLYTNANPDVQILVKKDGLIHAFLHFIQKGYEEIKIGKRAFYIPNYYYDEKEYYNKNQDVKELADNKQITCFEHYIKTGCYEILTGKRFCEKRNTEYEINKFKEDFLSEVIDPKQLEIAQQKDIVVPIYDNVKVSIIIPAYNQAVYTYNTIQSIINSNPKTSLEIIVMDDNSTQIEARELQVKVKNITFIENNENLGFLENCNKGADYANGEYILFLNNDVYVLEHWLDELVSLIESQDNIGMVGSKLVFPDGSLQEAGGIIWDDASGWNYGRSDSPMKSEYNYVKEVDYISGASIMIKKALWETIGGFDSQYAPAYYEDADIAFEVRKHHQKVLFQPKSLLVHFEGISNGTDVNSGTKKYQVINKNKFYNKWKDILDNNNFKNAEDVFLARDKSKSKKHIVVIDHYVPEFDKDAGSRTMYQYLLEFVELGFHVTFVPDNFYANQPYTYQLENSGVEVLYGVSVANMGFENWYENNTKYIDMVYLLRPHIAIKYIDIIKKYNDHAKIIYNGVDFHYLRLEREYELKREQHILAESKKYKEIEFKIFQEVDQVLTISEFEKNVFEKEFPEHQITVIPTYIYEQPFPLSHNSNFSSRSGIMFVGGFLHTPNKDGLLWFVKNHWPEIKRKNDDIVLNIVGSNAPEEIECLNEDPRINVLGFVSDETLNKLYDSIRLVIAPLTYGAGVKGKVIESIAQGVPIITTDIASEGILSANQSKLRILENVISDSLFSEHVLKIYSNEREWISIRKQQIQYSKNHFSKQAAKDIIKSVFKGRK